MGAFLENIHKRPEWLVDHLQSLRKYYTGREVKRMRITLCKEMKVNGKWEHFGMLVAKDPHLGELIHKYSDTLHRIYNPITQMFIKFAWPEDFVHTVTRDRILLIRLLYGVEAFDKLVGCWPFDAIDVFDYAEDRLELLNEYGITDARLVCFRE